MRKLERLSIENFKSIRAQTLALGELNVFIGANGAGKSNLIQAFKFLREIVSQRLAAYTATRGGADNLLYFGRKTSSEMAFFLEFGEGHISNSYKVQLRGTDENSLIVWNEIAYYHDKIAYPEKPYDRPISSYSVESKLKNHTHISARQVLQDLEGYRLYHFHDTSDTAPAKGTAQVEDNRFLREDAGNLAAFLYWMEQKEPDHFANVVSAVRQVAPFFESFSLAPSRLNESTIRLQWKDVGSDVYFSGTALSDGTLRFICLSTLLLQPVLPAVVLLDEPELGLHPAAITLLADLLRSASARSQVLVATQSVTLVNQLEPSQVWTVNRVDAQSTFERLDRTDMSLWLEHYSLGEMWEKNLLRARP